MTGQPESSLWQLTYASSYAECVAGRIPSLSLLIAAHLRAAEKGRFWTRRWFAGVDEHKYKTSFSTHVERGGELEPLSHMKVKLFTTAIATALSLHQPLA